MNKFFFIFLVLVIFVSIFVGGKFMGFFDKSLMNPSRFENKIRQIEIRDRQNPPEKGTILFIGSSSITGWRTLAQDMAPLKVLNRGFGGSLAMDVLYYADRIVIPYQPTKIVFYEGDNDIAHGKTPAQVLKDYQDFVEKVHTALPNTIIYLLSIKPSLVRYHLWQTMQQANAQLEDYTQQHDFLEFIDISAAMHNKSGKLRQNIFKPDGLHLNAAGYKIWTAIIKKQIQKR
jgi:lysophospholipase L1-like esterase